MPAEEIPYDGEDQDCDGADLTDVDGDGFEAVAAGGDDCDDEEAGVNPATPEDCDNGIDDDCDGVTDLCGLTGQIALDEAWALFNGGGGGLGSAVAAVGDMNGDGEGDLVMGAPGWRNGSDDTGIVYIWVGPVAAGVYRIEEALASLEGEADLDRAGASVAGGVDLGGDNQADVLVGAPGQDASGTDAGAVYIALAPFSGAAYLSGAEAKLMGENAYDSAGTGLAVAGDTDGDGEQDVLVGAPGYDGGARDGGAVYLVRGPISGYLDLSGADAVILPSTAGAAAGTRVAGGADIDGDGLDDVAVGAPGAGAGSAYVVTGGPEGDLALDDVEVALTGMTTGDRVGAALAFAGDVDGDGWMDLVVGAPGAHGGGVESGVVYLVLAPGRGGASLAAADAILLGVSAGDHAGGAVAAGQDLDGDGRDDLLVGACDADTTGTDSGAAYLVPGAPAGTLSLSSAAGSFVGIETNDKAGTSVAMVGDVSGDGTPDLVVGAPYYSPYTTMSEFNYVAVLAGGVP
ncbi:MAG: FG-GAP-like repeat-containing protein [Pseudomonadota bacterium]